MAAFDSAAFDVTAFSELAFLLDGDAPEPEPEPAEAPSGGFYTDVHPILTRGRRRLKERLDEIEDEAKQIPDKVAREIATLIKVQEAKADDAKELARLQALADRYAKPGVVVPRPVLASVMKAHEERTRNALEQMHREIERMMDDEEQAIIALLLMDD
jgi:hypothetical protein